MCPSSAFRGVLQLLHVSLKDNRHYWFWNHLWCLCGTQIQFKLVLFRGQCKTKPWKKVTLSNTLFTHLFCFLLQQFTLHTICSNCSRRFPQHHSKLFMFLHPETEVVSSTMMAEEDRGKRDLPWHMEIILCGQSDFPVRCSPSKYFLRSSFSQPQHKMQSCPRHWLLPWGHPMWVH